jgi:hypothetical protein
MFYRELIALCTEYMYVNALCEQNAILFLQQVAHIVNIKL